MLLWWSSFKVVLDSEDSDWLARLYPSPYTAAQRFGIVRTALNCVFMQVDVNANFLENDVCTGEILISLNTLLCVNVTLMVHALPGEYPRE